LGEDDEVTETDELEDFDEIDALEDLEEFLNLFVRALTLGYLYQVIIPMNKIRTARITK